MLFHSAEFLWFFVGVYALYIVLSRHYRWQNLLLLAASYYFYGYWDYRFLALIVASTVTDYVAGLRIQAARDEDRLRSARVWMWLSVAVNLSILGFFKYFNFFADSLRDLMLTMGIEASPFTLKIVLPVGISFYTFQTMSYTLDVYRGRQKPTRNFLDFSLFVAFFPQLMAGPIERAGKLLPQIQGPRTITAAGVHDGLWHFTWGFFKKVFIADNLASYVSWGFSFDQATTFTDFYMVMLAFTILFYCDFSGYSDMAIGLAKMLGIELSRNFNLPYFADSPSVLWSRWHITLSNWFRDYVYMPLRRHGHLAAGTAAIITMLLVGLWHGANWTYIAWGGLWGVVVVAHRFTSQGTGALIKKHSFMRLPIYWAGVAFTFHLWMVLGIMFVATDMGDASRKLSIFVSGFAHSRDSFRDMMTLCYYSWPLVVVQCFQYWRKDVDVVKRMPFAVEVLTYCLLLTLLFVNGVKLDQEFIYFQF